MAELQENSDLSQSEIFNQAIAAPEKEPEQPENTTDEPKDASTEAKEGRARDDKGRFTKAATDQPEEVVPEAEAEPEVEAPAEKPEKSAEHQIPSWRLAEEAQAKREALERLQAEQRQREHLQQQLWQLQQQMEAAKKPQEPIDLFADPQAYQSHVEQTMTQRLREMEGNFSLRLAAYKHGDTFQQAWTEMTSRTQSGDDSMRQQVINSPDPGETLVQLYKRDQTVKLVGDDPEAFIAKALDEALDNPEFLARALEKAKGVAKAQPTQQIKMPASINKATGGGLSETEDYSDEAIFRQAMRR